MKPGLYRSHEHFALFVGYDVPAKIRQLLLDTLKRHF